MTLRVKKDPREQSAEEDPSVRQQDPVRSWLLDVSLCDWAGVCPAWLVVSGVWESFLRQDLQLQLLLPALGCLYGFLGHHDSGVGTGLFVLLYWECDGSKGHLGNFFTF